LKFWILGFLIFFWKFSSLKNRKITKGTEPLNMFVYPTTLQEFRENRKRLENQRRLHDKDFFSFFSKRETNYDSMSDYSNQFGNYQNSYRNDFSRGGGGMETSYNQQDFYETENYSQNLYNNQSTI
jgi:hypothetical protein